MANKSTRLRLASGAPIWFRRHWNGSDTVRQQTAGDRPQRQPTLDDRIGCWTGSGRGIRSQLANLSKTIGRVERATLHGNLTAVGIELEIAKRQVDSLTEIVQGAMARWRELSNVKDHA